MPSGGAGREQDSRGSAAADRTDFCSGLYTHTCVRQTHARSLARSHAASTTHGNAPTSGGKNEPWLRARARARGQISAVHVTRRPLSTGLVRRGVSCTSPCRFPIEKKLHSRAATSRIFIRDTIGENAGRNPCSPFYRALMMPDSRRGQERKSAFIDPRKNLGRCVPVFYKLARSRAPSSSFFRPFVSVSSIVNADKVETSVPSIPSCSSL